METVHLIITGRVQGVFYRATAKRKAEELTIKGWIKNTAEGNVEAVITGDNQQVNDFILWCKSGPGKAVVEDVQVQQHEFQEFDSFQIER